MKPKKICIIGGSGFVGRHLATRLVRDGHQVRVPSRHPEQQRALRVLPGLELPAMPSTPTTETMARLVEGCDAVINLVGILNEAGNDGSGFRKAHVELPRMVIEGCRQGGIDRLLHMSALGADSAGPSRYLRTKAEGEALVLANDAIHATVFRPAVIFGPGDSFFNRFAGLLKISPYLFPLACAGARMQPIFVGDVVEVFTRALELPQSIGATYNLCGPRQYTLGELVAYTARTLGLKRHIIDLPEGASRLQAQLMEHLPGKPFTTDNYLSLSVPSICNEPFPPLFGITPTPLEVVVPSYLGEAGARKTYDRLRQEARRS